MSLQLIRAWAIFAIALIIFMMLLFPTPTSEAMVTRVCSIWMGTAMLTMMFRPIWCLAAWLVHQFERLF
ncbi:hypothetical protein [Aeoliella sp.]|uniref:hypothetical protein n=1 Tax=Aeoliella sp. TaxID=2795800 RepID=UPI003CCC164A